ncbi:hypothetical protein ACX800_05390 [Paenarthrobacter nitroguajacolicus]|uniref:hypothetical protein n=1 Tax=Paenarthrobacter nitroguajacolicus TaxID=211146 RepID=UPI003D252CEE
MTQAARDGDAVLNSSDASQTVLANGRPEVAANVRASNNNHHRPHTALGNKPPVSRLTNLPEQYN